MESEWQMGSPVTRGVALVVDDNEDIRTALAELLRHAGFAVHTASSGAEAVATAKVCHPDIVTMDVGLPDFDGLEASRRIRTFSDAYLIIVSGRGDEADAVMGFEAGADDYLTKPFRPRELRSRINAMLSRPKAIQPLNMQGSVPKPRTGPSTVEPSHDMHRPVIPDAHNAQALTPRTTERFDYVHGALMLDVNSRQVLIDGVPADLTRTQFDLLLCLAESGRTVRTKADLARRLRNEPYDLGSFVSPREERAIEVHIANLRKRLGDTAQRPRWIETVRGVGYRMTP